MTVKKILNINTQNKYSGRQDQQNDGFQIKIQIRSYSKVPPQEAMDLWWTYPGSSSGRLFFFSNMCICGMKHQMRKTLTVLTQHFGLQGIICV